MKIIFGSIFKKIGIGFQDVFQEALKIFGDKFGITRSTYFPAFK
jgi:hypothetical protein